MEKQKRFTVGRIIMVLALLIFLFGISRVFYIVGDYYQYLDAYSGDIARGDQLAAKDDLENLKYFYQLNSKLKPFGLSWVADKYFFQEALVQAAAYDYLTNRHERVIEQLKDEQGLWGRYLRANSKWRLAQGVFEQSLKKDPATKLKEQSEADEMASSTKDDYEEAVKISQGDWLPAKWNYDLTTNDEARARGLRPKPASIKIKLGTGGKKDQGKGKYIGVGPQGEGSRDLEIEGTPTDGKPKPGTKRPG